MTIAFYPDYESKDYTPNKATWLFVLIHRYRKNGFSFDEALRLARKEMSK